ncbi:MAG: hypothetical protein PHI48_05690 [Bacteroidales bacterium]|nr:hypothetical protein [Bacteroidales bacterium]
MSIHPTIIAAIITTSGAIITAIITKKEWILFFEKPKIKLDGKWKGISIYVPLENDNDLECVYKINADIEQKGRRIKLTENIYEILDFNNNVLRKEPRTFVGKGKIMREQDITIDFNEKRGLTCGVMYLVSDYWGNELKGLMAVTNPYCGKPVVVKILLRRVDKEDIKVDDLGFNYLRPIYTHYFDINSNKE